MNMRLIFGSAILVVLLLFSAGCTQPAQPVATPAPTAVPTTLPPTTIVPVATSVSTPGPTQTLPSNWGVDIQVASNNEAIDPQIVATFRGGKGLNVIPLIEVTVTRASDGAVVTERMTQPLFIGKTVSIKSSPKPDAASEAWGLKDRAEVWVTTPQGERVKIFDAYIPFRSYN